MNKELKIGVIGCGAIGRTHIERITTKLRAGKVIAVSDVNAEFGKKTAAAYGCEFFEDGSQLIKSPVVDAVIVTTSDDFHEKFTVEAVNAGKFVFCEKPLAPTPEGCERVVKAEVAGGKKLVQVGYMRRYDAGYRQLKKILDEKTYGEPLMIHCAHRNWDAPPQYNDKTAVENSMIHEIDVLRWLINEDYISAEVACPRKTKWANGVQDPQIMILTTKSGIRIDIESFLNCHYGYDIKCEVCCEEGILNLPEPPNAMIRTNASRVTPICRDWSERFIEAYNTEIQAWILACLSGSVDGPDAWDGYVAARTAAAASKARETGTKTAIVSEACPPFYKKRNYSVDRVRVTLSGG